MEKNKDAVERVYRMLADEKSRKVFRAVLEHRMSHDLARIDAVYDREQYFGNDVIPYAVGNFVDCGAFCGDTLKRFFRQKISWGGIRGNYYAFEADESNCSDILSYCESEHMQNVSVYHLAVCDEKKTVSFKQDGSDIKVTGTICEKQDENSILVPGDSLDSVLGGTKVDMITMDIEGAEIQALYGAQECIQTHHPKLAVSAYHELEHLWEIPLLIHRMVPDYRIFYRHHCWNMYDTVCYAV